MERVEPRSYNRDADAEISIGGIKVSKLVQDFASPLYVICEETLRANARAYTEALQKYYPKHLVLFASKALNNRAICRIVEDEGLGIDVVSGGELFTACSVKFPKSKIFFHGNNKSQEELEYAIDTGVNIVLDNHHDIYLLSKILSQRLRYEGSEIRRRKIKLMFRLTPCIECHTHDYIKTGMIDSKFGFNLDELDAAIESLIKLQSEFAGIEILGLHAHIGSQIFETEPHRDVVGVLLQHYAQLKTRFGIEFEHLNVGGGLGIRYTEQDDPPSVEELVSRISESVRSHCERLGLKLPRLILEPGRSIVGQAGITIYRVGAIKTIQDSGVLIRKYIAVDGGMADNVRPIMYGARYHAEVNARQAPVELVTIAGKYCESGDILIRDIELPQVQSGDLIVVFATGAYNYSMSSNYNRVVKPAMILVSNGEAELIVERESFDDIIRRDRVPKRLMNSGRLQESN